MRIDDPHLTRLIKTAQATGCRHVALALALAMQLINDTTPRSRQAEAEAKTAEAAWRAASRALDDYRTSHPAPTLHCAA